MNNYFEVKVKFIKIDQNGFERKVTENYLLDAVSYTDAEARTFKVMEQITRGEFDVRNIKKSNISEVISAETGEWWYKAKISLVAIDEEGGKEKKISQYILVMADNLEEARQRLDNSLSYMLVPYVVTGINQSTIAEVFPYDLEEKSKQIMKGENNNE